MDLLQTLIGWLYWYFRPVIKWFLRQTTRLSELQRICYGETPGAARTCAVENSLAQSRSVQIREALRSLDRIPFKGLGSGASVEEEVLITTADEDDQKPPHNRDSDESEAIIEAAINVIIAVKKVKRDLHIQFVHSLRACLRQICGYKELVHEVERLRSTAYDPDNLEHERSLLQLWSLLQPGIPLLTRRTKQWQNIGFQGDDPKTDFRGMGILGLQNLLFFAREYNSAAKHILSHSHHPKHGYSFAIVGINLTHMAFRLLVDGCAKSHIFNACTHYSHGGKATGKPTLRHFHHLYSYLFVEFDKFWLAEKPRDVMEFNRIRDLFENNIRTMLADTSAHLKINIVVDTV